MIQLLLPPGAIGVTTNGGIAASALLPAEARLVAGAPARRQQEFAAGRACARQALAGLGWSAYPVLTGPDREPQWPPGVVGSITHCPGYCAAAVARRRQLAGLGIDAEPNVPLDATLWPRVARIGELTAVGGDAGVDPAVLIFSAKEASFKAWFPLTRRRLELLDVVVRADILRRTFAVRPVSPADALPADLTVRGRWALTGAHVITVVTIVRDRRPGVGTT